MPTVGYIGAFDQQYPRNQIIRAGLAAHGWTVRPAPLPPRLSTRRKLPLLWGAMRREAPACDRFILAEFNQLLAPFAVGFGRRLRRPVLVDYLVGLYDAHVLDRETETIYGSSDSYPAEWTAPTSTWTPGERVVDPHTFTIVPGTPPGVYQIEVGVYVMPEAGVFERLPIIPSYGGQRTDVVYLSRVAVEGPSPGGETG